MKKNNFIAVLAFMTLTLLATGCILNSDETQVKKFGEKFAEMIQNKDEEGVKAVYPDAGDIKDTHLVFHRDEMDVFPEGEGEYKIRYSNGAYIIVKKGLGDAFEVVKTEGIYEPKKEKEAKTEEVKVAPLHKEKKSTPAGLPNYDWLSSNYVTYDDIAGKSGSELRIMRNYIYARHGYMFKSADLKKYFAQYSWYTPRYSDVSGSLNSIEKSNIQTILSYE